MERSTEEVEPLWTPWRMPYILGIKDSTGCIFCEKVLGKDGEEDLVIHRGRHSFVILNLYPYATGHLMVVPYRHAAELTDLTPDEIEEASRLLQLAERAVEAEMGTARQVVGINIGRCAGAGVEGHLHIHLVPQAPAGLSPAVDRRTDARDGTPSPSPEDGERIPEPLAVTKERLSRAWKRLAGV
jgi:ATP adenylyltransferase